MEFQIKDYHLRLLKRMYVYWDDSYLGAPSIDIKRPYGNSDVEYDVVEIVGGFDFDENNELSDDQMEQLEKIHRETQYALQICLVLGQFKTGNFYRECKYDDLSWKEIKWKNY